MHTVVLLHRCYPSTPHGVGPWLPAHYPTQEVTMSCTTSTPTARDYQLAQERVLKTLWLEADAMDVGFAAHVSYLAESLTLVHHFDLSVGHVPTQRFTDDWLDYIVDQRDELARFCDVCGFTWPPDERCPFH